MKGIKKILKNFNILELKKYLVLSVIILIAVILLSKVEITEAKYETENSTAITPNFAFFIVDVSTQSASLMLDNIVPRSQPYIYTFQVSNFKGVKKANVDLTYSIELISTTNLPLNIELYKGNNTSTSNYTETVTTNSDGVYFKHLLFGSISTMGHDARHTETYTLLVEFPSSYMNEANGYAGVIELIDIEIRAEQVVVTSWSKENFLEYHYWY